MPPPRQFADDSSDCGIVTAGRCRAYSMAAMGYEIHIERCAVGGQHVPVTLEEWRVAVAATEGIRLAAGDLSVSNPVTGEVITIGNAGGDAEVSLPNTSAWCRVFIWSRSGRISFRAPIDFDEPTCHVRTIAEALARLLNASLVGDEGEVYERRISNG